MLLLCTLIGILCFYIGLLVGSTHSTRCISEEEIQKRIKQEVKKMKQQVFQKQSAAVDDTASRFPSNVEDIAKGISRMDRDDFAQTFDMGVPLDQSSPKNSEVLLLYSSQEALPDDPFASKEASSMTTVPLLSAQDATANCDFLNVVLTDHSGRRRQCIALFGQYEAFHVQKWMRLPQSGNLDATVPLRLVNRGAQASGRKSTKPPDKDATLKYWSILTTYLSSLEASLDKLKPIAEAVAINNTIIVLVCNYGQSELLLNFLCSAKRRGLDLSHILVFATDIETRDLIEGFGVRAFYDETNFGSMPKGAARAYADKTFMSMMMAKVFCVQMISMLGYDILFQDVDVIWYRDPLEYFHNSSSPDSGFDTYFQDDGNHAIYYAPYSANTGFYYVRNNERTRYFFNSFLMAGDLIIGTRSHQVPLVALLQEHASMYGLKVKIFSRDGDDFPGGHAYHRRKDFMRSIINGEVNPYIFHMSWTHNKENKVKYYQQMGEWYLENKCIQKNFKQIIGVEPVNEKAPLFEACCAAEPMITCHYRDKPSKIPCKESPPIDKGGKSFW